MDTLESLVDNYGFPIIYIEKVYIVINIVCCTLLMFGNNRREIVSLHAINDLIAGVALFLFPRLNIQADGGSEPDFAHVLLMRATASGLVCRGLSGLFTFDSNDLCVNANILSRLLSSATIAITIKEFNDGINTSVIDSVLHFPGLSAINLLTLVYLMTILGIISCVISLIKTPYAAQQVSLVRSRLTLCVLIDGIVFFGVGMIQFGFSESHVEIVVGQHADNLHLQLDKVLGIINICSALMAFYLVISQDTGDKDAHLVGRLFMYIPFIIALSFAQYEHGFLSPGEYQATICFETFVVATCIIGLMRN